MDIIEPQRKLTNKNVQFKWMEKFMESFAELKRMLSIQTVMANFKTDRKTRLYVDHGSTGVAYTVAPKHTIPGSTEKVWRPLFYMSRVMTLTK